MTTPSSTSSFGYVASGARVTSASGPTTDEDSFMNTVGTLAEGGQIHFRTLPPQPLRSHNLLTLGNISVKNIYLIRYLLQQGRESKGDRVASRRDFYPAAQADDWQLIDAGIRVQAIKSTEGKSGIVHYGTEVVTDPGKSICRATWRVSRRVGLCFHRDPPDPNMSVLRSSDGETSRQQRPQTTDCQASPMRLTRHLFLAWFTGSTLGLISIA